MINIQKIKAVLSRMAELLHMGGRNDWALALENFEREILNSPDVTSAKILSTFGGMGSLNDVILYKNGQPLVAENSELDELRLKLFRLCREL